MGSSDTHLSSSDDIRPFEWLTNASSLKPILLDAINGQNGHHSVTTKRALHVGCGSSTVGEFLVQELNYDQVVNVDKDGPTLQQMETRWQQHHPKDERLVFCKVDLVKDEIPYPPGHFDVVIDKSTLDCTLCSDEATAALLCQVYRSLNADHGVYVVISFHHVDLLLPLLRDCPGTDWEVSHQVICREVEDVVGNKSATHVSKPVRGVAADAANGESAWATGSFQPTEGYRTTVNVMICKRNGNGGGALDLEQVRHHVHETNDAWFQAQNPMLTRTRHDELQTVFKKCSLELRTCYTVLFTDAEREHLTFEHFMEDWNAFLEPRPNLERDSMSFETAVAFLEEMQ